MLLKMVFLIYIQVIHKTPDTIGYEFDVGERFPFLSLAIYRCHERIPWKVAEFLSGLAKRGGVDGGVEKGKHVSNHKCIPSMIKPIQSSGVIVTTCFFFLLE